MSDALRQWFEAACDLPEDEWEPFLRGGCADSALRAAVLDLLRRDRHDDLPLDHPLLSPPQRDDLLALATDSPPPRTIGDYGVVALIGRGSMGTVYEARRPGTGERVAIKILRDGLPSRALLHRFRREAETLARLEHRYIARILEVGTADLGLGSLPFIVMEFVSGTTVDVWQREHGPDRHARLELLARIGEGVEHAHRRGVIHRDLKPSNVLVDPRDRPKLLDFGVARSVGLERRTRSQRTATGQLVGTLQYMSPEQTLGNPRRVDARSDVYSLGVMAYELLSGHLPYDVDNCALDEALRRVQWDDPPRLGVLDPGLAGPVEAVVTRALEKQPERRYGTMAAFVADLRAALVAEPVTARTPGVVDQMRKFARRNPAVVRLVSISAALLLLGLAGTTWGWVEAHEQERTVRQLLEEQRRLTERAVDDQLEAELAKSAAEEARRASDSARHESQAVLGFVEELFESLDPDQLGGQVRLADVLELADPRLEARFAGEPLVAARLHGILGKAHFSVADHDRALEHFSNQLALLEDAQRGASPSAFAARLQSAVVTLSLGRFEEAVAALDVLIARLPEEQIGLRGGAAHALVRGLVQLGDIGRAEVVLDAALDSDGDLAALDIESRESLLVEQALLAGRRGEIESASATLEAIRAARAERLGAVDFRTLVVTEHLCDLLMLAHRFEQAEALLLERRRVLMEHLGSEHPHTLSARGRVAFLRVESGRGADALDELDELVDISQRVLGRRHPRTVGLVISQSAAAMQAGRADAATLIDAALALGRGSLDKGHPNMLILLNNAAALRTATGRFTEAAELLREALALCDANLSLPATERLLVQVNLAGVLHNAASPAEAEALVREALPAARAVLGEHHRQTLTLSAYLAEICSGDGRWDEAAALFLRILGADQPTTSFTALHATVGLGIALLHTGHQAEGTELLGAAVQEIERHLGPGHALAEQARAALAAEAASG